jgi:hypothetical protein
LGDSAAAVRMLEAVRAAQPSFAAAHFALGVVLRETGRCEAALDCFKQALQHSPGWAVAYNERGHTHRELGDVTSALADYDRAWMAQPDFADARLNAALCRLLMGHWADGFRQHEWRWRASTSRPAPAMQQPLWLGATPLAGTTLLLLAEQGHGDTLAMARYAELAAAQGATVHIEAPARLQTLLSRVAGVAAVHVTGTAPTTDLYCPMMSLPLAFGTTPESIPGDTGYLRTDPGLVASWQARLGARRRPRVGLVWSGSDFPADRAVPLERLLAALPPGLDYVSLQKEARPSDRAALTGAAQVRRFEDELGDFDRTAALVDCLDEVVTIDTAMAHLAGGLRKPLCVLLPQVPDWRWLLDRSDSPWYRSARLFRQQAAGRWDQPLHELNLHLLKLARQDA